MRSTLCVLASGVALLSLPVQAQLPPLQPAWPGAQPDGSVLLPNQWSLHPLGQQVRLGDFPANIAVHPHSRYAAVLNCGYGKQEVAIVDLPTLEVVSRAPLDQSFYGVEFSPDGRTL